jgi:hypothetical protein
VTLTLRLKNIVRAQFCQSNQASHSPSLTCRHRKRPLRLLVRYYRQGSAQIQYMPWPPTFAVRYPRNRALEWSAGHLWAVHLIHREAPLLLVVLTRTHPRYENRPLVLFEESVASWTWKIHLLLPEHQHWRHLPRATVEPSSLSTQAQLYYPKNKPNARVHPSFEDRPPRPKPTKVSANREVSTRVQRKVHRISRHSPIKRSTVRIACAR